jgi:hypothetical protein
MNEEKEVPVFFRIHQHSNDAAEFFQTVRDADQGYLEEYDALVLDNAAIHSKEMVPMCTCSSYQLALLSGI